MHTPTPTDIPSEQTIEVLSNHFLLVGLKIPSAWIFCPTRAQEQQLGYDGALQNGKIVVIQYKRIDVNDDGSVNAPIDAVQHATLLNNFPKGSAPYVFYGFSIYPSYQELDLGFQTVAGPEFFANMRFVSLHEVSPVFNSITHFPNGDVRPIVNHAQQQAVPSITGDDLVDQIIQCTCGLKFDEFLRIAGSTVSWRQTLTPNLSVLIFTKNPVSPDGK